MASRNREAENREQREQARQAYQEAIQAPCVHGPRKRAIGEQDGRPFAMMACPAGSPNCGIFYPSASVIFRQWRDGQPDTAGSGSNPV
jgi:hypothetical protein